MNITNISERVVKVTTCFTRKLPTPALESHHSPEIVNIGITLHIIEKIEEVIKSRNMFVTTHSYRG